MLSLILTQREKFNHDFYKPYYFSIFSFPILIPSWLIPDKPKLHHINKDHARILVPSAELALSRPQIILILLVREAELKAEGIK